MKEKYKELILRLLSVCPTFISEDLEYLRVTYKNEEVYYDIIIDDDRIILDKYGNGNYKRLVAIEEEAFLLKVRLIVLDWKPVIESKALADFDDFVHKILPTDEYDSLIESNE